MPEVVPVWPEVVRLVVVVPEVGAATVLVVPVVPVVAVLVVV